MNKSIKIIDSEKVFEISQKLKLSKSSIGMCHGVFDLLHPGHYAHFQAAKAKVDVLFVSLTSDRYVNKGPGRPLFTDKVRAETISMLECVDYVFVSDHETAVESINLVRPEIYFKGSDYINVKNDVTGMINREIKQVKKYGGIIAYTDEITSSSTWLINNYFSIHDEVFENWLRDFKSKFSFESVIYYLDMIEKTRVSIIGEVIIDKYTNCEPLAKSSKDPILAFQIHNTDTFLGGSLAILDNIRAWTDDVSLFSCLPKRVPSENQLLLSRIMELKNLFMISSDDKLIIKHRFVDLVSKNRIFEVYDFKEIELGSLEEEFYQLICDHSSKADMWIVVDYGHGLISRDLAKKISNMNNFIAVNTQANAGNRGYNTITKYPRVDFLCLNGGELQLELREKNPNYIKIVPEYMERLQANYAILTLGAKGMMVFSNGSFTLVPALGKLVIDKVGAGDSVLAIGSILARNNAPVEIVGLVSSIVAAHEISQLGHRSALRISDIKKTLKALLG
jgi:rfaE bifunctional protein nucleotidyltransferase chain/domain